MQDHRRYGNGHAWYVKLSKANISRVNMAMLVLNKQIQKKIPRVTTGMMVLDQHEQIFQGTFN